MILEDAKTLALLHMEEHGVADKFSFEFENTKTTLGRCHYLTKRITLSKWYVELNKEKEIEDTILHEIAHALAWIHDKCGGHGKIWKDWARKVGAVPKACSKSNLIHPKKHYKYTDICSCGKNYHRHRKSNRLKYNCPLCKDQLFVGQ